MPVPGRPGRSATSRPAAWPRNQVPGTLDETVIQLELETGKYALPVGFFSRLLGSSQDKCGHPALNLWDSTQKPGVCAAQG